MTDMPNPGRVHRFDERCRGMVPVVLVLLLSVVLGATLHELHHISDPACGARGDSHGCWCTSLHASATTVPAMRAPEPAPVDLNWIAATGISSARSEVFASGPARAPPVG
jgi:hypothetical protein